MYSVICFMIDIFSLILNQPSKMTRKTTLMFVGLLRTLLITLFKLTAIVLAYSCKLTGTILLKVSEVIERILAR